MAATPTAMGLHIVANSRWTVSMAGVPTHGPAALSLLKEPGSRIDQMENANSLLTLKISLKISNLKLREAHLCPKEMTYHHKVIS